MRAKFVNEVGEATVKAAKFEYTGEQPFGGSAKSYVYTFATEKNRYEGTFLLLPNDPEVAEYHFNRQGKDGTEIVNAGDLFIVMSTNVNIINDFVERMNIKAIVIKSEKTIAMQKRLKLYAKFIQKHLPEDMGLVTDIDQDENIERMIIYNREWSKKRG